MEFANSYLINLGNVKGPFERNQIYLFLEKVMLYKTEKKNLTISLNSNYDIPRPEIQYFSNVQTNPIIFEEKQENGRFILTRKQ